MASSPAASSPALPLYKIHASVTKNGDTHPDIEMTVNGSTSRMSIPFASNHTAYYLAVLNCIVDAVAAGHPGIQVEMGDQTVGRQLLGTEAPKQRHTAALLAAVESAARALPRGVHPV